MHENGIIINPTPELALNKMYLLAIFSHLEVILFNDNVIVVTLLITDHNKLKTVTKHIDYYFVRFLLCFLQHALFAFIHLFPLTDYFIYTIFF